MNNTPWGERHLYVVPSGTDGAAKRHARHQVEKAFHVSPFMPMDIGYKWLFTAPDRNLAVQMENFRHGERIFDATLALRRKPLTSLNCARVLVRYPLMTVQVVCAIYWQALRLLLKGTPVFPHPSKTQHAERGADTAKAL